MDLILIKYGELTTKKGNRKTFITKLKNNIEKSLTGINYKIKGDYSRMYIETDNITEVTEKLKKVFGIHEFVISYRVDTDEELIKTKVLELLENKNYKTFKVNTKRSDKDYKTPSMEFNNIIGGHVLKNTDFSVDVHNPEIMINIEIRKEGTFIYLDGISGAKGYPVGIQGKGMLMLSGGIDSPVAGYLALKRGIDLECIYFDSPPHTSIGAKNKVLDLANILNEYSNNIKVNIIPFTKLQEAIYKHVPSDYVITIMRRMMYRISEQLSKKHKCKIIINGESIGQVASQTLDSISVINRVITMPVLRPVACLDKLEIIEISKTIKTYEISIIPYEDCCTIFVPKHPVINPVLSKCEEYENLFNWQDLLNECVDNVETIKDFKKEKNELL